MGVLTQKNLKNFSYPISTDHPICILLMIWLYVLKIQHDFTRIYINNDTKKNILKPDSGFLIFISRSSKLSYGLYGVLLHHRSFAQSRLVKEMIFF